MRALRDAGPFLEGKMEHQQWQCVYTGEKLIAGVNASVDHRIPSSRGGSDDLCNLQWVTKKINRMKGNMTHQEFVEICQLIAEKERSGKT